MVLGIGLDLAPVTPPWMCDGTVLRQFGEVPQGAADSQTQTICNGRAGVRGWSNAPPWIGLARVGLDPALEDWVDRPGVGFGTAGIGTKLSGIGIGTTRIGTWTSGIGIGALSAIIGEVTANPPGVEPTE